MPAQKLLDIAEQLSIGEGVARARKQDVIFALLKVLTRHGEGVAADGVLEILPDGFGFLRAAEASYLAVLEGLSRDGRPGLRWGLLLHGALGLGMLQTSAILR